MIKSFSAALSLFFCLSAFGEALKQETQLKSKEVEDPKIDKETTEVIEKEIGVALPAATNKEERKDLFNLTAYEPIYFIHKHRNSKAQASFKYRVLRESNLYVGYTHLIMWNLESKSAPITDVNYNPEVFYRQRVDSDLLSSIDYLPYGHKSNGKEGKESRSYNYAAMEFHLREDIKKGLVAKASIRLRYLHTFDKTNSDLREYLGPVEAKLSLAQFTRGVLDKGELSLRVFTGGTYGQNIHRGGQEIGLSFRLKGVELTPSFYIQYYRGYSESLQFYDQKENSIRVGVLL